MAKGERKEICAKRTFFGNGEEHEVEDGEGMESSPFPASAFIETREPHRRLDMRGMWQRFPVPVAHYTHDSHRIRGMMMAVHHPTCLLYRLLTFNVAGDGTTH